jgi:hypothetical protein
MSPEQRRIVQRIQNRAATQRRRDRLRSSGLCIDCAEISPGFSRCKACRDYILAKYVYPQREKEAKHG